MSLIYTFGNPPTRPTIYSLDDLDQIVGRTIYVIPEGEARPVRLTVSAACVVGSTVYLFDTLNSRPIKVQVEESPICGQPPSGDEYGPDLVMVFNLALSEEDEFVRLPIYDIDPEVGITVDWGDGTVETYLDEGEFGIRHQYMDQNERIVRVSGKAEYFGDADDFPGMYDCLTEVISFGSDIGWRVFDGPFYGCQNLTKVPANYLPPTVTELRYLFAYTEIFNQDISGWDTSNVEFMDGMFRSTKAFNQPLVTWDVSSVQSMSYMFEGAEAFNQDISGWDTSNVIYMQYMFAYSKVFNQPLESWDLSSVTDINYMFAYSEAFNQNLDAWRFPSLQFVADVFAHSNFNGSVNGWDMSNVSTASGIFRMCESFNQPLDQWDISNIVDMNAMLYGASSFNQDLSTWKVAPNMNGYGLGNIFDLTAMSPANTTKVLIAFANSVFENGGVPENVSLGMGGLTADTSTVFPNDGEYSDYEGALIYLENERGWTINFSGD